MIYPDTSMLVAIYVGEPAGDRLDEWWSDNQAQMVISGWTELEFTSALAMKERSKAITADKRGAALALFTRHWAGPESRVSVPTSCFSRAATMISAAEGLRGADALHLAVAEHHGASLFTLDRQQAELGRKLGVMTQLL
jgi:predicted nucleic acid-binding protein